jgi:hypothetical protein
MSSNLSRRAVSTTGFSFTRLMFHAFCLFRRPGKAAFFFAGMRREFSLAFSKERVLPRPLSPMECRLAAPHLPLS